MYCCRWIYIISSSHHWTGRSPTTSRHSARMRSIVWIVDPAQVPAWSILPSRSTEVLPTSWQRMIKWEWEQVLPVPLHTACQSHEQVGLWDSCAFLLATEKEAGLWTSWRITEEKGKRLRYNPVHETEKYLGWEVWDTKQSLPIAVCCLGEKAERNQFYYPMTYLSQGKYRDTSDTDHYQWNGIAPTIAGSYHIPERNNSASQWSAYEWITGKIMCCLVLFYSTVLNPCFLAWKERWSLALLSGKNLGSEVSSIPWSPEETLSKIPGENI